MLGCIGLDLWSTDLLISPTGTTKHIRTTPPQRTTDGFEIAEQDLRLRGPGELTGSRQSGHKGFRLVDLVVRGCVHVLILMVVRVWHSLLSIHLRTLSNTHTPAHHPMQKHADLLEEAHALAQSHALRLAGDGDGDAALGALLRLFDSEGEGEASAAPAPSKTKRTRATKAEAAVSSTSTTTSTTSTTTTTTAGGAAFPLPPSATPFPPHPAAASSASTTTTHITTTTVVTPSGQLEGWTTTVYGDRYQVYSPPPSPEEDGPMDLAALAARTQAAAAARPSPPPPQQQRRQPPATGARGGNGNGGGDTWGSFYPQPEVPRVAIDLEAVDATFVLFDLETTGLNAERERIIQVAAKVLTPASWVRTLVEGLDCV